MKRTLFFTTSGNYVGGGVMCLIETLKHIDRSKLDPYVVIPNHGTTEDELKKLNIRYSIIRCYDWLIPKEYSKSWDHKLKKPMRWLVNIFAEYRFYRLFKDEKIECFHLNSVYNDIGVNSARKLNIPVFWHLREFVDENPWSSSFTNEDKAYRKIEKSTKLLAVSHCIKDYYHSKMPSAKIEVVYDGVDTCGIKGVIRTRRLGNSIRLSMIGGVTEVKGHLDALRAMTRLNTGHYVLTIYGRVRDGVYVNKLNKYVFENNLQCKVFFAGNVTDMKKVWENTDITLVCSKSESFGRVAIESMSIGIPVIGSNNSGTKELITSNCYGILYETGNDEDLANKILALGSSFYSAEIIKNSIGRADSFSSEESAKKLMKAILI